MITLEKLLTELKAESLNEIVAGCHCKVKSNKVKSNKVKSNKVKSQKVKSKKSKKGCPPGSPIGCQ